KFYSLINIFGLAIGLAVSMIIMLYVQSDLSYDKSHENHAQLYRIESKFYIPPKNDEFALTSFVIAEMMKDEFPEIENFARFQSAGRQLFRIGDKQIYQDNLYFADTSTFSMFTHKFIMGDPKTALTEPNTIVLTESAAKRLFGTADALNNVIESDVANLKVTGIIEDLPDNLHLTFEGLVSFTTITSLRPPMNGAQKTNQLWNVQLYSYLMLPPNFNVNIIYDKFPAFFDKYMQPLVVQANLGDASFSPRLVPITDIHFNSKVQYDLPTGNKAYTQAFTAIGIFILLLASINYMNLATARATNRSKEVGVRKVLGSSRVSLRTQFLGESVVITLLSLLLAVLIVNILIYGTGLNSLLDKDLTLDFLGNNLLLFGSIGVAVVIGILSGIYPAFYLSSISVLKAMKGSVKTGPKSVFLRKSLVAFQFFISIAVVITTLLMNNQINFLQTKDLGFNKDNVVLIPIQDTTVMNRLNAIKNELNQNPNILAVSDAFGLGGNGNIGNSLLGAGRQLLKVQNEDNTEKQDTYNVLNVGKNYIEAFGMEIIAGRSFDESIVTDITQGVIVNEATVKQMGWTDPIGKIVSPIGLPEPARVIGVVKDFNAFSLHVKVEPTAIYRYQLNGPANFQSLSTIIVHIKDDATSPVMRFLETKFAELDPNHPFEYDFLDQQADQLYRSDLRQSQLNGILSYICILISCLGLLGLASFTTATRIKEIGVRKVLGATVPQLVFMIFKDILILVLVGFIIAIPAAYYLINDWLSVFAYRMNLQEMIIVAALFSGLIAIVISFLTVSFHSFKAAQQNPIKALRYE
ncbi:MAG: putative ABC transport system permease protein, partial [Roseivirga sp.]